MTWQVALGLFFVVGVCQALLQRSYSQTSKLPESFPPALSYLIGVTPLGIIVGLFLSPQVDWSWWLGLLLVIEGIFIGLYNWLSFKAIRRLPLARYQTIYQLYEFVVIVLGWTLLAEGLTRYQVIGGLLLLIAAYLAIRAPRKVQPESKIAFFSPAVLLAIGAAVSMGIGLIAEKAALRHMNTGAYFIFGFGTQTVALLVLAAKDLLPGVRAMRRYDLTRSLAMGVLSACLGFFYIVAIFKSDNVSLITALAAFLLPLVVLSGYIFLHERDERKLVIASVGIGFIGLLISALH